MAAAMQNPSSNSEFELIKTLEHGVEIVARKSDGERFVSHHFYQEHDPTRADLNELFSRGAGQPLMNLLNHENLVSVVRATTDQPLTGAGNAPRVNRLLWDYCDAGTLVQLLENPPVARKNDETGFLPEGLVWHVGVSMLRALQWLHEGIRDTYETEPGNGVWEAHSKESRKYRGVTNPEKDWLPVLHREIHPENIFFQLPRGIETYGMCKLGNFSHCYISGNISSEDDPLVAPPKDALDMPIETLRARWAEWDKNHLKMAQDLRPFTRGCELFELGKVLFRMMSGFSHPDPEECSTCQCYHFDTFGPSCTHRACPSWRQKGNWMNGYQLDERTMYTRELRNFATDLLLQWRTNTRASEMLSKHWPGYVFWTQDTLEGQQHNDVFDDIRWRKTNSNLKQISDLNTARETLGVDIEGMLV